MLGAVKPVTSADVAAARARLEGSAPVTPLIVGGAAPVPIALPGPIMMTCGRFRSL
jgi:hypothetical protein